MTSSDTPSVAADSGPRCPFDGTRSLPRDGTPLRPSSVLGWWRSEADATPLAFADGHQGWIVTGYELARDVLADSRFSMLPMRMPTGPSEPEQPELDEQAREALWVGNPLALDGEEHTRVRRAITGRFSLKAAHARREEIRAIVHHHLGEFLAGPQPADLTTGLAEPISNRVHCEILGIPHEFRERYHLLFAEGSRMQDCFDLLREILAVKRTALEEDVLSDLLRSTLTPPEIEGAGFLLMVAGRDSVIYMVATSMLALLTHPEQLAALRDEPELMPGAIEEFLRFGTMFVTVFPRTAQADLELGQLTAAAGQSVAVSTVAANRDPRRFADPDVLDVRRDAYGHLGFGFGPHGCVGQQVARIEVAETIGALLAAAPRLRLVGASQLEPLPFAHDVATYRAGAVEVEW